MRKGGPNSMAEVPHESKYARKRRERREGTRPEFEFVETVKLVRDGARPKPQLGVAVPSSAPVAKPGDIIRVTGVVIELRQDKGFVLTQDPDGVTAYVHVNTIGRDRADELKLGDPLVVDASVQSPRDGKTRHPRAVRVVQTIDADA